MTKDNNSNIKKLNVNLRQTKSAQQTNTLGLSMAEIRLETIADQAERLRKEALDQPRKEAERAREICEKQFADQTSGRTTLAKQLADQFSGRGMLAKQLADQESEHKRQIEKIVKELMYGSSEQLKAIKQLSDQTLSVAQAFDFFADINISAFEISKNLRIEYKEDFSRSDKDFDRAMRLLELANESDEIEVTEGTAMLENELQANGALTSRQLFFLIAISKVPDFIPRMQKGLKLARVTAAKNKTERAEEYHELWRKWADETLKANPTWNQDRIAKHVLETATKEGHKMANGNPYKVGTIKKKITGHRKALI